MRREPRSTGAGALPERAGEHAFLLRVAELLHAYGTPAYRLERVLQKVARSLDVPGSFLSTPTSVLVSLGEGATREVHLLRSESGEVNLGKLIEFDEVMEDVEHGRTSPAAATERLERIAVAPSRYPAAVSALGYGVASAAAARFFGGGGMEIGASFVMGLAIYLLSQRLPRRPDAIGLREPLAAFSVALVALLIARVWLPLDDRVVTLASLVVLLPGLALTTGLTELATRHLVSGVARIAGAAAVFLMLLFGVALAWRIGEVALSAAPTLAPSPRSPSACCSRRARVSSAWYLRPGSRGTRPCAWAPGRWDRTSDPSWAPWSWASPATSMLARAIVPHSSR
jgi:uncharacterized membrane protein YjjP (DUF1212 family)